MPSRHTWLALHATLRHDALQPSSLLSRACWAVDQFAVFHTVFSSRLRSWVGAGDRYLRDLIITVAVVRHFPIELPLQRLTCSSRFGYRLPAVDLGLGRYCFSHNVCHYWTVLAVLSLQVLPARLSLERSALHLLLWRPVCHHSCYLASHSRTASARRPPDLVPSGLGVLYCLTSLLSPIRFSAHCYALGVDAADSYLSDLAITASCYAQFPNRVASTEADLFFSVRLLPPRS